MQNRRNFGGPVDYRLLASGRAADVYDLGDGTVLRRYRSDRDTSGEARVMQWLRAQGVPVPKIHDSTGGDLVMEMVNGPTLMEALEERPWTLISAARTLAKLQSGLNELTAPDWFPAVEGVPDGNRVLHLDLHPMNVMMSDGGPVVIDWTNASRGPASFDAAMTTILMSSFETTGLRDRVGQRVMVQAFKFARGRSEIDASLASACRYRLTDPNITTGERSYLKRQT